MDYILKEEFLPLEPLKQANVQYYQWIEKKRIEKEKAEYQKFQKQWYQLEEQEKEREKTKNKTNKQDTRYKSDKQNAIQTNPELTYMKNMIWKQTVQTKLQKIRLEQNIQHLKEQLKHNAETIHKQNFVFRDPQHKGPVKAWQQRFEAFLKVKQGSILNQTQTPFHPVINDNSRKLTRSMVGRVQKRLIDYGERVKEKRAGMEAAYEQQLCGNRSKANSASMECNVSDTFLRLYKDSQRINRQRNQQVSSDLWTNESASFHPTINENSKKLTQSMVGRVQNRLIDYGEKLKEKKSEMNVAYIQQVCGNKTKPNVSPMENEISETFCRLYKDSQRINKKRNEKAFSYLCVVDQASFHPIINQNSRKLTRNMVGRVQNRLIDYGQKLKEKKAEMKAVNQIQENENKTKGNGISIKKGILDNVFGVQKESQKLKKKEDDKIFFDLWVTDRPNQQSAKLNKQIQQDSIEEEKNNLWVNELEQIELQIESMMKRATK